MLTACGFQATVPTPQRKPDLVPTEHPETAGLLTLHAPLSSHFEAALPFNPVASAIELSISIPDTVQTHIGCGVYIADDEGRWMVRSATQALSAGQHHLQFSLGEKQHWVSTIAPEMHLHAFHKQLGKTYGCYFWSEQELDQQLAIHACKLVYDEPAAVSPNYYLSDVTCGLDGNSSIATDPFQLQAGQRWSCSFRAHPVPGNPYNSRHFVADLCLADIDSGAVITIPAFYQEPLALLARGSDEEARPLGQGHFCVRFRPQRAARYRATLHCHWPDHEQVFALPDLHVSGPDWDDIVRSDTHDKRFLSVDGAFFWPTGINLKSANDDWCASYLKTTKTPSLGTYTYEQYLSRLQKAGGNVTEIWMCNWNLALEWFDDWESYRGLKGFSAKHACQLDAILDSAYTKGIRVIISFRNHGQGHTRSGNFNIPTDTNEWHYNPYNKQVGGFLDNAVDLFTDPEALRRQQDLHRYIIARYADHPAVMMWKLWSEVDLTDAAKEDSHRRFDSTPALVQWHQTMSKQIADLDIYDHLICAHYSTDFHRVDTQVYKLPDISASCINAYLWRLEGHFGKQYTLAQLLYDSCNSAGAFRLHDDVLRDLQKPIIVSEYGGGNPFRMTENELRAHHHSAPWAAFLSGHATGPLFFWYEWIDQREHWQPLSAVKRFARGEDLRNAETQARPVLLSARHAQYKLWSCAWVRPGRLLAYIMDRHWGAHGTRAPLIEHAQLHIGKNVKAGLMQIEWWDASLGQVIKREHIQHPGGDLQLQLPTFRRHLACKVWRSEP